MDLYSGSAGRSDAIPDVDLVQSLQVGVDVPAPVGVVVSGRPGTGASPLGSLSSVEGARPSAHDCP